MSKSASAILVNNGGWVLKLPQMRIGKVDLKWQLPRAKGVRNGLQQIASDMHIR